MVTGGDGSQVTELLAGDVPTTLRIAAAWCGHRDIASVTVCVSPANTALVRILDAIAEATTVRFADSWQVFDWPAVLIALLRERVRSGGAEPGSLVLQIGETDRLLLSVDGSGAAAVPTEEPEDFMMDEIAAMRARFRTPAAAAGLAVPATGIPAARRPGSDRGADGTPSALQRPPGRSP